MDRDNDNRALRTRRQRRRRQTNQPSSRSQNYFWFSQKHHQTRNALQSNITFTCSLCTHMCNIIIIILSFCASISVILYNTLVQYLYIHQSFPCNHHTCLGRRRKTVSPSYTSTCSIFLWAHIWKKNKHFSTFSFTHVWYFFLLFSFLSFIFLFFLLLLYNIHRASLCTYEYMHKM